MNETTEANDDKARIAFLGTGAMGSRMIERLLDAGHDVRIHNRTEARAKPLTERGARWAPTPRECAQDREFVISMVRDDEASRNVWLDPDHGAAHGLADDAIAIECSTLSIDWAKQFHTAVTGAGAATLDAPVVGTRPHAESGALTFLVGGERRVLDAARSPLGAMGHRIAHVGPAGSGSALKLAVNALFGVQVAAAAELLQLLKQLGLDVGPSIELLGQLPVTSPAAKQALTAMHAEQFAPQFPIELVEKDLAYLRRSGQAVGCRTPMADAARALFGQAQGMGHGEANITAVVRALAKETATNDGGPGLGTQP